MPDYLLKTLALGLILGMYVLELVLIIYESKRIKLAQKRLKLERECCSSCKVYCSYLDECVKSIEERLDWVTDE